MTSRLKQSKGSPVSAPSPIARSATAFGGQSLDKHTQATMSARFGHDFSQVRIHTDRRAEDSAQALGANAFATGSDITFGPGKYTPGSPSAERLLAHELTHVVQQSQFGGGDWGRMSHKSDVSEREADTLASQVMLGRSVQVLAAPGAAIARNDELDGGVPAAGLPPDTIPSPPGEFPPLPPGGAPDPLNPEFPKPPPLPRIPDTPPGGFPKPPPSPASPAGASGGGILNAVENFAVGVGSRLGSFLPPMPRWLFHPEEEHANEA